MTNLNTLLGTCHARRLTPARLVSFARGTVSAGAGKPCAFHALQLHCRVLHERFANRRDMDTPPLFPDPDGNTARKNDVVRLIEQPATRLGLATHSLRVQDCPVVLQEGSPAIKEHDKQLFGQQISHPVERVNKATAKVL